MRFIGLFLLIGSLFISNQSLATQPEPIETKKSEIILAETLNRLERVEIQLSVIRDYNDDFLAVIGWALGIVGTMTVVLIGFNWFQNSKLQKREFDSLKNEMIGMIHSQFNESSSKLNARLANLDNDISKRVENIVKPEISNIKQVLLIPKYIELENKLKERIESKQIWPHDIERLADCAVKIGDCFSSFYFNDLLREEHSEDYCKKLLKLIENLLNTFQNNRYENSLELLIAIEKSINMVPNESVPGDHAYLSIKKVLLTRLQNMKQ